jgi:hypothetical protein
MIALYLCKCSDSSFPAGTDHCVLEAAVNDVMFFGTVDCQFFQVWIEWFPGGLFDDIQHLRLAVLFPLLVHAAEPDVAEVLEPFKVRNDDTTRVNQKIW